MRCSVVGCVVASFLSIVAVGFAQDFGPKSLDRSFQRPGARALGMGGAYLLAADDATAVAWNPAALGKARRLSIPIEVVGRANFDVRDVTDLVDDLETIRDQTDVAAPAQAIQAMENAFNRVRDFSQKYQTLYGSVAPIGGISFGRFGLSISSGIITQVDTRIDATAGQFGLDQLPQPNLYARGGAIALTNIGLAYAHSFRTGITAGLAVRSIRVDFAGFLIGATTNAAAVDAVIGQDFGRVNKTRFTADLGLLFEPPVQPPVTKLRYAAVVRNIIPSEFDLPARDLDGNPVTGYDFSFRLNPQLDIGISAELRGRTVGVLELHNITSSNGGNMSLHAGIEHWFGDVFALRVGYDDDRFVFGLGINLKVLRIDIASGFRPRERFATGISFRF